MEWSVLRDNGWDSSAAAWIADMGETGDFGRAHVLDGAMLERIRGRSFRTALDVGCGEGRFCRMLRVESIGTIGVEPVKMLRETAMARDPTGTYLAARAEALPFREQSFDLVVSYLTLIDIDGIEAAIDEMARVLRPGGALLIANLNGFSTAGEWHRPVNGRPYFSMDSYLDERSEWVSWRGITIRNWHRPFSRYMQLLLQAGLRLSFFDEPAPTGGDPEVAARYRRVPYFHLMEWQKP
jgi:SAM-dependent methyltransferase